MIKLNHYFVVDNYQSDLNRLHILIDASESKFWTIKKNCYRNINKYFSERNFNDEKKKILNQQVLKEMNEAENTEHDYLLFMRNTKYTDIANSLSKYDYYNYIIEYDKNDISHDDIYNIILKIKI